MNAKYAVTIEVTVYDEAELQAAAEAKVLREGTQIEHWRSRRAGPEADLIMLLDPGESPPGCDIGHCFADTQPPDL